MNLYFDPFQSRTAIGAQTGLVASSTTRRLSTRLFFVLLCTIAGFPAAWAAGTDSSTDRQPNILLITADDLGLQLSCYGDETAQTPNIDALAGESVQFRTAYVSQASCSPSRSTMFTGLYPHGNGHYGLANANVGFQVHPKLYDQLLPNVLKKAGYRTGIIGKLHVNPEKQFDFDYREGKGFGSREIRKQVQFADTFIQESGDEPWFLMFNVFDPHVARSRKSNGQRGPQYFPNQVGGLPKSPLKPEDIEPWPWQQIDTPAQRKKIAGYYNCVQRIDIAIGLLMEELKEAGHWDNTVIIFLGDHGPPFARGKTSCYESGLRVPFLARWPGVSKAHVSERLVGSIDIYPTIMDAAGIDTSGDRHGKSLRSVLQPVADADWRTTLGAEFHYHGASPFFPRRAVTDGRWKLIHNIRAGEITASPSVDGDQAPKFAESLPADHQGKVALERLADPPEWELYDLQSDPNELTNLSGDPNHQGSLKRMQEALRTWQKETQDPFTDAAFRATVEQKYR